MELTDSAAYIAESNEKFDGAYIPHSWIWDLSSFVMYVLIVIWIFSDLLHNKIDNALALAFLSFLYINCHMYSMNMNLKKLFDYYVPLYNISEKYTNYFKIDINKRHFKVKLIGVVIAPFVFICIWITSILAFIALNILTYDVSCDGTTTTTTSNDSSNNTDDSMIDNTSSNDNSNVIDLINDKCHCKFDQFTILSYKSQSTQSMDVVLWWHIIAAIIHSLCLICTCAVVIWSKKEFERLSLLLLSMYGMMAVFSGIVPIYYSAQVSDSFTNCVNDDSLIDSFQFYLWIAFLCSFIRDVIALTFNFYMLNKKPKIKRSSATPWYK